VDNVHYRFWLWTASTIISGCMTNDGSLPRGPRPRGTVRAALVEAGVELARSGGPDAVVLREVTRMVGVVPNAAYRHFPDRDALLAAVRDAAIRQLAQRMAQGVRRVPARRGTRIGAQRRLDAVGRAYLEFARGEPGLFDTAFTMLEHPLQGAADDEPGPFDLLKAALDELVEAGILEPARRPTVQYPIWATVHGLAVLFRGPLRYLRDRDKSRLEAQALAFIEASLEPHR
jgi:AcrR family transcriptional regulator